MNVNTSMHEAMDDMATNGIPEHLFRFRTWPSANPNRTRQLLEEGAFYCSSPREFDDPHDSLLGAHATGGPFDLDRFATLDMAEISELMRKYQPGGLPQLFETNITDPKDRATLARVAQRHSRRHSRVLCFSSDWASELMWAFYADNHKGLCLCFETNHDFFKPAKPVLYTHLPTDVMHLGSGTRTADQLAFCKSLAWQFQKEWRILFPGDEPRKVPFPKQTLKAVILGYRFPHAAFDDLKNVLVKSEYQVKTLHAQRVASSYELVPVEIPTEFQITKPASRTSPTEK